MSDASERKRMTEALAGYSLLSIPELAEFLGCSVPTAKGMVDREELPSIRVGKVQRKVDPIDAAVHVLADREGMSREEYWARHGEATAEKAGQYYRRVMRFKGEAA